MIFVFAVLAIALGIAAARAPDRAGRLWWGACCLLNVLAVVVMLNDRHPHAFNLAPNPGYSDNAYRR